MYNIQQYWLYLSRLSQGELFIFIFQIIAYLYTMTFFLFRIPFLNDLWGLLIIRKSGL